MPIDSIDEINAYKNDDGTFCVELHGLVTEGQVTITIPVAMLELQLTGGMYSQAEMTVKLEGCVACGKQTV